MNFHFTEEEQDILETFFQNTMWKDHKLNKGEKGTSFLVDENLRFKICPNEERRRNACDNWRTAVDERTHRAPVVDGCSDSYTKEKIKKL